MNKPMYCPLSFANGDRVFAWGTDDGVHINKRFYPVECTPNCALAVTRNGDYACAIGINCGTWNWKINSRPIEDDAE